MRVLLVDDHDLFRYGLKAVLTNADVDLELEEASGLEQALQRARTASYELILLDLKLPGVEGTDGLKAMRQAVPHIPVVVLSGVEDPRAVREAIEMGAMGFVPKTSTPAVLIQAMRLIAAGGVYLPPPVLGEPPAHSIPSTPASRDPKLPGITPRQMDVLRCVIQGKQNKVIAHELGISEGTVKAHLSGVMQAVGARNRTEAVYAAAKLGLRFTG